MCLSNKSVPVFSPSRPSLWLQLSEQVWIFICSRVLAQPRFYAIYEVLSLFGFPFSQCRPRKLSVGQSRPMRSGTKENFTTRERVCTLSSNFTRQIVTCVPTVPHITGHSHEEKKANTLKFVTELNKKSCTDFLSLCNVSHYHGSPPTPCPTPFLTPGNSRQSGRILVVSAGAGQPLI